MITYVTCKYVSIIGCKLTSLRGTSSKKQGTTMISANKVSNRFIAYFDNLITPLYVQDKKRSFPDFC